MYDLTSVKATVAGCFLALSEIFIMETGLV